MAKRISTSFLFFITEFTSFPIYRAGFSIFSNISSFKASFLIFLLSFLFNIYKKVIFFSFSIFTKNSCFFMIFRDAFQYEKCCFSPDFCPCVTNLLFFYCAALCIIIHHFHSLLIHRIIYFLRKEFKQIFFRYRNVFIPHIMTGCKIIILTSFPSKLLLKFVSKACLSFIIFSLS